jgi:glycosyltransferase involved in cell wall biosynthesis
LSLAMLEAMACGCAVIATDAGADGEALGATGIIIDPESIQPQLQLATQILITHPDFARGLGQRARERAVDHYSLERNIGRLVDLYNHVLGRSTTAVVASRPSVDRASTLGTVASDGSTA